MVVRRYGSAAAHALAAIVALGCLAGGTAAFAQDSTQVTGQIEWGVWVDRDGCQHWWADGGTEGYMVPRRNPKTGKPVCLQAATCLAESTDTYFNTASATLTTDGRKKLQKFFSQTGAFSYMITGHTDSRGTDAYNLDLSKRRAKSVADVARSVGAVVDSETGLGESKPIASNGSAAGMAKNRRVEIICTKG